MSERMYPIQRGPSVPYRVMIPHESQSKKNHGQSIDRIAERGGFSPAEAWAVINALEWDNCYKLSDGTTPEEATRKWVEYAEKINNHYSELHQLRHDRDRLHRILTHIASRGIHTDRVDAQITMSGVDQSLPLIEVLEREISRGNPNG